MYAQLCHAYTVLPNLSQHKFSLSQRVGTHRSRTHYLREASSKGRIISETHHPRDALSKGSKVSSGTFRDTLFGDISSHHGFHEAVPATLFKTKFILLRTFPHEKLFYIVAFTQIQVFAEETTSSKVIMYHLTKCYEKQPDHYRRQHITAITLLLLFTIFNGLFPGACTVCQRPNQKSLTTG